MQNRFFELDGKRFVIISANGAGARGPRDQAELTLARIQEDLGKAGSRFDNLLRITVYMRGKEVGDPVRAVRARFFGGAVRPASSSIFVDRFRPEEALVEIEATALVGDSEVSKGAIEFDPPRRYLKALVAERCAFLSGAGGDGQTEEEQAESCFKDMEANLKEQGGALGDLRRISIYLKRMEALDSVSRVLHRVFTGSQPHWEIVPASGFAREEMLLEIEGTAVLAHP